MNLQDKTEIRKDLRESGTGCSNSTNTSHKAFALNFGNDCWSQPSLFDRKISLNQECDQKVRCTCYVKRVMSIIKHDALVFS